MFSLDLSCLSGSWVVQWIWHGNFYLMASISNQCRFCQFSAENWIIYPCKDPGSNSLYWVEFWICKGYEFEIFTSIVFDEKWSWCLHFINQELRSQNSPAKSVKFVKGFPCSSNVYNLRNLSTTVPIGILYSKNWKLSLDLLAFTKIDLFHIYCFQSHTEVFLAEEIQKILRFSSVFVP